MGTAAALEIPFMLLAGYYTRRFGKRPMMLLAVLAGVGFYGGLVTLSSQHALIALQLLNAIFIGIVAGIGMSYFQDLMPGRAGVATTLFSTASAPAPSWRGHRGDGGGLWSFTGSSWWRRPGADGAGRPAGGSPTYRGCKGSRCPDAGTSAPVVRGRSGLTWGCLPGIRCAGSAAAARPPAPAPPPRGEQVGVEIAFAAAGEIELHQRALGELLPPGGGAPRRNPCQGAPC